MSFISTYLHASVHRRGGVICVGREKSKVHSGFVALIYSAAAGFCPVIMCREKNGDGEAFTHRLLGLNMLQLSVWFHSAITPIMSSIADSQGIDQQSFLASRSSFNLGNGSISFL